MKNKDDLIKKKYILPKEGELYKANLHCHTVISDGRLTPEEVKEAYCKEGYSIIAFTDHNQYNYHPELNDENFLSIAAFEADINEKTHKGWPLTKTYHINFYDCNPQINKKKKLEISLPDKKYHDIDYINSYLRSMKKKGFLSCYNHPYWSMQNYNDYSNLKGLWSMEIYNYGCEVDGLYGFHPQVYDEMLRNGQEISCVAVDDNHNRNSFEHPLCDSFGGFVMIKASELSYEAVIHALKKRHFYWSMGPFIKEAYIKNGKLHVETSPVQKIYCIQQGRNCYMSVADDGGTLTKAEFGLTGNEGYIRIQIRDEKGLYAGTNAVFI